MEVLRILDEKKLEELVSNMDDRIRMHDYSKEQLLLLIEDYVTINFQGMKYQTREAILNMICDAVNYYDIGKDLNWESIIAIREDLEDDLKEYTQGCVQIISDAQLPLTERKALVSSVVVAESSAILWIEPEEVVSLKP